MNKTIRGSLDTAIAVATEENESTGAAVQAPAPRRDVLTPVPPPNRRPPAPVSLDPFQATDRYRFANFNSQKR